MEDAAQEGQAAAGSVLGFVPYWNSAVQEKASIEDGERAEQAMAKGVEGRRVTSSLSPRGLPLLGSAERGSEC